MFLSLTLLLAAPAATAAEVKTDRVLFSVRGERFAEYRYAGTVQAEKGGGTQPLAKPFAYPVYAPDGTPVTRGWPMVRGTTGETVDHFHQKSVWFCHGDVIPEGVELKTKSADKHVQGVDFWTETKGHGRIVCTGVTPNGEGGVKTTNEWRTPDGVVILTEVRTLTASPAAAGNLLVFDIALTAAVPVTFGDTKEGSMGTRPHDALRTANKGGDGQLSNSAGKSGEKDVWGYEADWCDYSGTVDGKKVGLALFADPANKHRSAWHARGYGLMAANPFGRNASGFPGRKGSTDLVKLAKGETLPLRFGVYAHTGDVTSGKVAEAFGAFTKK